MTYLCIYDPSKTPAAARIAGAVAVFRDRFGTEPAEVLVNPIDAGCASPPGVRVRVCGPGDLVIGPDCYAVGAVPSAEGRER